MVGFLVFLLLLWDLGPKLGSSFMVYQLFLWKSSFPGGSWGPGALFLSGSLMADNPLPSSFASWAKVIFSPCNSEACCFLLSVVRDPPRLPGLPSGPYHVAPLQAFHSITAYFFRARIGTLSLHPAETESYTKGYNCGCTIPSPLPQNGTWSRQCHPITLTYWLDRSKLGLQSSTADGRRPSFIWDHPLDMPSCAVWTLKWTRHSFSL